MPIALYPPAFESQTFATLCHANGFFDEKRALSLLQPCAKTAHERAELELLAPDLLRECGEGADPTRALLNFSNLCDRAADRAPFFARLRQNPRVLRRLCRLFSWSQALSDAVVRDAQNLELVFASARPVSRGKLRVLAQECADLPALRRFRRAQFLRIGLLDLERDSWRDARDFALVTRQISDLARVVIARALEIIAPHQEGFCVILMGKGGARELNYSSDVDLIFLSENGDASVGEKLLRELGALTADGFLWRADLRLRPDGTNGPLVTPFGYALSYYESYAGAWEWQALIKARVVAGDARLGRRFRRFTRAITWARRADDAHLREVFEMKRRAEKTADGQNARNLKNGPGGIRDVEWIVQQLQIMLGPTHPRARRADTLGALMVLHELDALSADETRVLRGSYLWLRVAEHRLQLWNEQPVREIPTLPAEQAALARRLGCAWRGEAAARWLNEEKSRVSLEVRALFERIFGSFAGAQNGDWLDEFGALWGQNGRDGALVARLERLAQGTKSQPFPPPLARQNRAVLPLAFAGFDRAADPQKALVAFENLADASGNRLSLFRSLAGTPRLASAIWTILGGSTSLSQTLTRAPQLLDFAANRALLAQARTRDEARTSCRDYVFAFQDAGAALRRWRARELLRIGLRDLVMNAPPAEIGAEIAFLADACLGAALESLRKTAPLSAGPIGILALGKWGGFEMHTASDLDAIFVGESGDLSTTRLAESLIRTLGERTCDGAGFELDARLRPFGHSGPLVTTLQALGDYLTRPQLGLAAWERQALTRARIGGGELGLAARAASLGVGAAFPPHWNAAWSDELRHIKMRVENERTQKGRFFDAKLGRGTLADIEWSAQWLAMKNGARCPILQTPSTRRQLVAARECELISHAEWQVLNDAHDWFSRAQFRHQIAREEGNGAVKADSPETAIWARALFPTLDKEAARSQFETEWHQHAERVRAVFERVRDEL